MYRRIYLRKRPWREALETFLEACQVSPLRGEKRPVEQSLGRVTSEKVAALISSPSYDAAAMDGVAVRAEATEGASSSNPKRVVLGTEAEFIETGEPIGKFDSVIMIEEVNQVDEERVEFYVPVPPFHNVRRRGEDFEAGAVLISENCRIRPMDIAGMLAGGITKVLVRSKPRVAIIPTGSELVEPGDEPEPGQIVEYNSRMVAGMIVEWGGEPKRCPSVGDDLKGIEDALLTAAAQSDLVVSIAGSSAGSGDLIPQAVEDLGEILVHGVDLMPGKPTLLGKIGDKPLVGLPGYPVSTWIATDTFLRPMVSLMLGLNIQPRRTLRAALSQDIASKLGMEEVVRVTLSRKDSGWRAVPLPRGAGVISSLMKADGLLRIPPDLEGLNGGSEVEIELLDSWIVP